MDKLASSDFSLSESLHLLGQRAKGLIRYLLFRVGQNSGRKIVFLVWDVVLLMFHCSKICRSVENIFTGVAIYEPSWAYDGQIVDLQQFIYSKRSRKAQFLSFSNRVAIKECSEE